MHHEGHEEHEEHVENLVIFLIFVSFVHFVVKNGRVFGFGYRDQADFQLFFR